MGGNGAIRVRRCGVAEFSAGFKHKSLRRQFAPPGGFGDATDTGQPVREAAGDICGTARLSVGATNEYIRNSGSVASDSPTNETLVNVPSRDTARLLELEGQAPGCSYIFVRYPCFCFNPRLVLSMLSVVNNTRCHE